MEEEEMIPITQQEVTPPPPPPPVAVVIEIVEDDEEIEEIEIEETEVDEETEIEIVEEVEEVLEEVPIFAIVEDMPTWPGCSGSKAEKKACFEEKMMKFLYSNVKYPAMAKDANIQGVVYLNFEISEKGNIKDIKILRGIGGGCDEESIRVVKMMPQIVPGQQRGKPARVTYNLPLRFSLK
jgi:protein TonB